MKKGPLLNMIPFKLSDLNEEFNDVCEYVYAVTHLSSFNKKRCSYFGKGIAEVLRCFGQKFKPTRISEKAFTSEMFNEIKDQLLRNDTYKILYNNKKKYKPLLFEHIVPLGSLIARCHNCISIEEVANILSELEFTIILEEENNTLTKNGYRSKGREQIEIAELVYKKCGIQLMKI